MSQSSMQDITCPACGTVTPFLVWDSINTFLNPEMKEKVRTGEAFQFHCPHCGARAMLNYNFLYHQQEDKVLIYVGVSGDDGDMRRLLSQRGNAFDGYRKRIVYSYNEFLEKLLILDAGLDDRIVEIIKSSVWANVEERYKDQGIEEIYFSQGENGEPGFIFRKGGQMVASMALDTALYNAIHDAALFRINALSKDDLVIDRAWAEGIVEKLG